MIAVNERRAGNGKKGSFVEAAAVALVALAMLVACGWSHPADQELIDRFTRNRATFELLRDMFIKDAMLGRVAHDFTRPVNFFSGAPMPRSPAITSARLAEYRRLFTALQLGAGVEGYDAKDFIMFHASTRGLSISGSSKGYVYAEDSPALLVDSLDTYNPGHTGSFTVYRHIEGKWYLYYDYEA